ncbi:reticulocalbin-2 [Asbolus verrucosus]|uniref:Reticulocalbin-3 n=1 Tax=Asbolus verrucosus TaxID=1661398 RepID=A0A482W5A2_ASBVE|nr:reticulocalbin-2 [Asbolus verrucosus]
MRCVFATAFAVFILNLARASEAGVVHSHSTDVHKERESDGAYSPRDHSHFSDGGEHHSEFDHEAILGSHKEAEEYDHLTPEEAKRRLKILLKKMDLNGDEMIDKKELKAWILRSFRMLSEEEASERLEDADENNDGVVTWNEYLLDAYGLDDEENLSVGDENDHLIKDDKEMWKAADVNNDGVLDPKEWVAFSHPEEHPAMLPIILEQTLRDKDKDGDRFISFQEFVGERAQDHDKEWLQIEKDKFDHDLDKDGDGKLSNNEILSWVVPSNEEIAEEEVEHLFASSDDDHDDLLNFDEVLEHHETFVGSEATDYGDHLHNIHHFEDEL